MSTIRLHVYMKGDIDINMYVYVDTILSTITCKIFDDNEKKMMRCCFIFRKITNH